MLSLVIGATVSCDAGGPTEVEVGVYGQLSTRQEGGGPPDARLVLRPPPNGRRFLVRLRDDLPVTPEVAHDIAGLAGAEPAYVFKYAFHGLSVDLPHDFAANAIRGDARVEYVYADQGGQDRDSGAQSSPGWALDRIDQRSPSLDATYNYVETGEGVHVFIIDSGIDSVHPALAPRIANAYHGSWSPQQDPFNACNTHGTEVAAVAASSLYGAAKAARLHSLQVSDCGGSSGGQADPTEAIEWAIIWALDYGQWPAVINYSRSHDPGIGIPPFDNPIEDAVRSAVSFGIPVVTSPDNENGCDWTPARIAEAIAVGGTSQNQDAATWPQANRSCIDIWAPGDLVLTAQPGGGSVPRGGTSMATGLVSGVLALILDDNTVPLSLARSVLVEGATTYMVSGSLGGSADRMLNSLYTQVRIYGPTTVDIEGSYFWTAQAYGGNKQYTYQWQRKDEGTSYWNNLIGETGTSLSLYVGPDDPSFDLRVVTTSFGDQVRDTIHVSNLICSEIEEEEECNW